MPFMLTFDKQCRIIKSKNSGQSGYTVITDSIFESGKITVIDSFFHDKELTRIDTLIINKVEIRRRNNKTISYDKAFYKSYKSGAYINDRIEHYKQIRKWNGVHIIRQPIYLDHGYYTPPRRVDGNFYNVYRDYYRMCAAPGTRLILRRIPYLTKKFYLAQTKTFYLNISNKSGNLYLRDKVKFFVKGEDFNQNCYYFKREIGRPYCRVIQQWYPEPIKKQVQVVNNKNLIDSIFTLTYYGQANDKPCVKPKDSLFTDYLRGYSGEPEKNIQYYFRYEYFDE
jgi:hypothetical protein